MIVDFLNQHQGYNLYVTDMVKKSFRKTTIDDYNQTMNFGYTVLPKYFVINSTEDVLSVAQANILKVLHVIN